VTVAGDGDVLAATDYPDGSRDEWTLAGLRRLSALGHIIEERVATQQERDQVQAVIDDRQARADLATGLPTIQAAKDAAQADIATAQAAKAAALQAKADIDARRALIAGSTPAATLAYVTAIRDELVRIYDWLSAVAQSQANDAGYRAANDANAVTTDGALLWLARREAQEL
jgi:hypothetical protein